MMTLKLDRQRDNFGKLRPILLATCAHGKLSRMWVSKDGSRDIAVTTAHQRKIIEQHARTYDCLCGNMGLAGAAR